jgi:hypothetical protein
MTRTIMPTPVKRSLVVNATAERAFNVFTAGGRHRTRSADPHTEPRSSSRVSVVGGMR